MFKRVLLSFIFVFCIETKIFDYADLVKKFNAMSKVDLAHQSICNTKAAFFADGQDGLSYDVSALPELFNKKAKNPKDPNGPEIRAHQAHPQYLSEGSFGKVFKVDIDGKSAIVKVISKIYGVHLIDMELYYYLSFYLSFVNMTPSLYNCFYDRNYVYLISERMDGSLVDLITEFQTWPFSEQKKILVSLAEILLAFDQIKLVHRDIKPNNFLYNKKPDGYEIKVIDFGLSSLPTDSGQGRGTIGYMAPELFQRGKLANRRSDMYAMGMTFHVLFDDGIEITEECDKNFTRECFDSMDQQVRTFYREKMGFPDVIATANVKSARNLNEIVYSMTRREPMSRPTPDLLLQEVKKLGDDGWKVGVSKNILI